MADLVRHGLAEVVSFDGIVARWLIRAGRVDARQGQVVDVDCKNCIGRARNMLVVGEM